jgi:hypothetical protein
LIFFQRFDALADMLDMTAVCQIIPGQSFTTTRLKASHPGLHFIRETIRIKNEESTKWEKRWTGDYIFENEWRSFRTKKDRSLELKSVLHEWSPERRRLAAKVVDIFANNTMTIVDVSVRKNGGKK